MVLGGWGVSQPKTFVYTSPAAIRLHLTRRERWIFINPGVILTLITHWLEPPLFLLWCSEATIAVWGEGLAKNPHQKNISPAARLETAIYTLQVRAFYQLSYPGPFTAVSPKRQGLESRIYLFWAKCSSHWSRYMLFYCWKKCKACRVRSCEEVAVGELDRSSNDVNEVQCHSSFSLASHFQFRAR